MAFLKQPRREPLKLISRSRENDKRRSERELGEVSAFFLHKDLPESYDALGRKQAAVSGLSSLDEVLDNSSTYNPPRRQRQRVWSPGHRGDGKLQDHLAPREQILRREREDSRATCFTWSASHHSNDLGLTPTEEETKRQQSSTPMQIREALARSGVFDNTSRQQHDEGSTARPRDYPSESKSQGVPDTYTIQVGQEVQSQSVRIVRYRDCGIMASEDKVPTGDSGTQRLAQSSPTNIQDLMHATDHSSHEYSTTASPSKHQTLTDKSGQQVAVDCLTNTGADADAPSCERGNTNGPTRPKSPKCAVIEQLEAAAEGAGHQNFEAYAVTGQGLQPAHQDGHASDSYSTEVHPVSHESAMQSAPNSGHFQSTQPSGPYLSGPGLQYGHDVLAEQPVNTLRGLDPTLRKPHSLTQYDRSSIRDVDQSMFGYSLEPIPSQGASPCPLSQRYATMHSTYLFGSGPRSQTDMIISIPTGHMQTSSASIADVKGQLLTSSGENVLLQESLRQQSMQDYISQLEQDVLNRHQEDDDNELSPVLQRDGVQPYNVVNMVHVDDSRDCGQTGRLWEADASLRNQSHSRASLQSWVNAQDIQEDEEEQRFASTFWRPNRHPM